MGCGALCIVSGCQCVDVSFDVARSAIGMGMFMCVSLSLIIQSKPLFSASCCPGICSQKDWHVIAARNGGRVASPMVDVMACRSYLQEWIAAQKWWA